MAVALLVGACGGDSDTGSGNSSGASADVEQTVQASIDAENAKDVDKFLAVWTDKGLESYDAGTRAELKSGEAEGFGENDVEVLKFGDTKVEGAKASTVVDVAPIEFKAAKALFRAKFALVKKGDAWLIDGFNFTGIQTAQ